MYQQQAQVRVGAVPGLWLHKGQIQQSGHKGRPRSDHGGQATRLALRSRRRTSHVGTYAEEQDQTCDPAEFLWAQGRDGLWEEKH